MSGIALLRFLNPQPSTPSPEPKKLVNGILLRVFSSHVGYLTKQASTSARNVQGYYKGSGSTLYTICGNMVEKHACLS